MGLEGELFKVEHLVGEAGRGFGDVDAGDWLIGVSEPSAGEPEDDETFSCEL